VALDPGSVLLTDRVAIVTGAGQGIGKATALLLARFGARLAVCDRVADTLAATEAGLARTGHPVVARALDVRDQNAVTAFVADATDELGRVDVLVNNAGGTFFAPFLDVSEKGERALVLENFTQVTGFTRAVVPVMPDGGAIVNVTSIEAHQAAPGFAVYAAMKAAVASLTRTLALELAPRRIRVNAVAPDAIPTEGDHDLQEAVGASGVAYEPALVPPLGFLGSPDDAAAAVLFLAGDLARFVTGTTIHVDGGNWAAGGWRRLPD
jgi:NAD(P)-dependent dehydrogenase (short-subunit alcohol dehydrogenase family)